MRAVSRFESRLLHILHALLGRAPMEGALPLIADRIARPRCLGRPAVELVQDALAKGCAWRLARLGGWRPARHPRGERVAAGRLWDRTPPEELGLDFSPHAMRFLLWLTAENPGDRPARWDPPPAELTMGDRVLIFLAFDALRVSDLQIRLRGLPQFARDGLCRLAFADEFAQEAEPGPLEMGPWTEGVGACVFEALQPYLASRWATIERQKSALVDPARMRALGREQDAVLGALLPVLDAVGRRDLARFLLSAASAVLRDGSAPRDWVGSLNLADLRLADRAEAQRAALSLLRALPRLRDWERAARTVGYFDEGYAVEQLWLADWAAADGDALCDRAAAVARDLDPLHVGA